MNKSNYALISALYDTKGANLYNDIYFPIIKYEIANQYYTQSDVEKYYDLTELQDAINTNFGVKIPLSVLKQSIKAIEKGNKEISISVYEHGKQFKIKKAWDISLNTSIDIKAQEIATKFNKLEQIFQRFLEVEQLSFNKSFSDFYSDNTEEIFNYLEEIDNNAIINENYVNLTRFLTLIKNENVELFNIANDVFWGSIIAGFLKRNTAEINIKPVEKVEYYLDSALVLSILDLDNTDNVSYGQELLDIIKSSGNIPKVHALTIREISNILTSVEREQGPRPNSAIEGAYYRRDLSPTKILHIKNKLHQLITDKGIIIFPASDTELDKIEVEYKSKKSVNDLEKFRSPHYFNHTIRDIHDVYLRDFIQRKRERIASIEKINSYFVSLNSELISYFKRECPLNTKSVVIHPAKIITDLWIHNSNCTLLKKNALTEAMSRCFAMNNTDIRRKLRIVSKYYKDSSAEYSDENYRAVYSALINRSTHALKEVDSMSLTEQENPTNKEEINSSKIKSLIKISTDEQLRREQNLIALTKEKEKLEENIKSKDLQINSTDKLSSIDKERIKQLERELNSQKQKNKLTERINEISTQISELEKDKDKSISMFKYWIIIIIEGMSILGLLLLLPHLIYSYFNSAINFKDYFKNNVAYIFGFLVSLIGFVCRIHNMYLFSPKIQHEHNRDEQTNYWIKKNPKYNKLKEQFLDLQKQRNKLNI